jgi:hypothetical protein
MEEKWNFQTKTSEMELSKHVRGKWNFHYFPRNGTFETKPVIWNF